MSGVSPFAVYEFVVLVPVGVVVAVGAGDPCGTANISQEAGAAPFGVQDNCAVVGVIAVAFAKLNGGKHAGALQSTIPEYNVVPAAPVLDGFV